LQYKIQLSVIGFILALIVSCSTNSPYNKSIETWHNKRIENLKNDTGWLTLAGLYWLKPGENSFGADSSNRIIFPNSAPAFIGSFFLEDSSVRVMVNPDIQVENNGKIVTSLNLKNDLTGSPTMLTLKTLVWYVIRRGDKTGIRLKDKASPLLQAFTGIERFPVKKSWRIKARLIPASKGHTVQIPNVLGQMEESPSPGMLAFEHNGKPYTLKVLSASGGDQYWIIFADKTNGDATYGGGRFLYVEKADSIGETFIDFNKAYNPPCVFTPFATCPLPPEGNRLDFAVEAGEKMFGSAHN